MDIFFTISINKKKSFSDFTLFYRLRYFRKILRAKTCLKLFNHAFPILKYRDLNIHTSYAFFLSMDIY